MEQYGVDPAKLVFFASDGCNVMMGSEGGAGVLLQRELNPFLMLICCMPHRYAHDLRIASMRNCSCQESAGLRQLWPPAVYTLIRSPC